VIAEEVECISVPKAFAMVTSTRARTVCLNDRGRIATGLRADLVRVFRDEGVPVSRSVWREGRRVA
jgi:alpha-D-ribose 1-methylphosphonate 5-triphosphate diphosphatase